MDTTHVIIYSIIYAVLAVALLAFALLVYKDALLLVTRPATLGTGLGRIWAVGRLAVAEAWAAKAWVVPLIWLVACCIINLLSRAYDDTERVSLYVRVLLQGQEFLCLIILGVMACYSFPRERDRRTIITTASKPISRLEYFLGKVVGFCTVALLLLGTMTVLTWLFMLGTNEYIKSAARVHLESQQTEYDAGISGSLPPSPALRRAAAEGQLRADDYITAPAGMQVAGRIDYATEPPTLLIKGGSAQKVTYMLGVRSTHAFSRSGLTGLPATRSKTPFFFFNFGYSLVPGTTFTEAPKITVHAYLADSPNIGDERTMALGSPNARLAYANWSIEDPYRFFWYDDPGAVDPGPLILDICCNTPNIYLHIYNGVDPNESNVKAVDLDGSRLAGGATVLAAGGPPKLRGFEKGDGQQIEGPRGSLLKMPREMMPQFLETASWRFHNIKRRDVPVDEKGNFTISLQLDEDRSNEKSATLAAVRVYRIFYPNDPFDALIVVDEKRLTELKVPARLLDKTGMDLVVDLRCLTPKHWIGALDNGVRLERKGSFFLLNLIKSEMVIFCECALVILIGVTCSLRVGWPVAMLVTGVCYLLGNIFQFVDELVRTNGYSLLSRAESQQLSGSLAYRLGVGFMNTSIDFLYLLVNALPNFTHFDALKYIVESRSMPWVDLLFMVGWLGVYAIPFIAIGYLLIRKQELA